MCLIVWASSFDLKVTLFSVVIKLFPFSVPKKISKEYFFLFRHIKILENIIFSEDTSSQRSKAVADGIFTIMCFIELILEYSFTGCGKSTRKTKFFHINYTSCFTSVW